MSNNTSSHTALKIAIRFALNIALVWALSTHLTEYFDLTGGIRAYVIIGALITLLNILLRPVLAILTLPLRLFASLIATMIVNGGIVYVVQRIGLSMDPEIVQLEIYGGLWGWIVLAICFGLANWLMKVMFR